MCEDCFEPEIETERLLLSHGRLGAQRQTRVHRRPRFREEGVHPYLHDQYGRRPNRSWYHPYCYSCNNYLSLSLAFFLATVALIALCYCICCIVKRGLDRTSSDDRSYYDGSYDSNSSNEWLIILTIYIGWVILSPTYRKVRLMCVLDRTKRITAHTNHCIHILNTQKWGLTTGTPPALLCSLLLCCTLSHLCPSFSPALPLITPPRGTSMSYEIRPE